MNRREFLTLTATAPAIGVFAKGIVDADGQPIIRAQDAPLYEMYLFTYLRMNVDVEAMRLTPERFDRMIRHELRKAHRAWMQFQTKVIARPKDFDWRPPRGWSGEPMDLRCFDAAEGAPL
jgi:hypothetical protein